MEVIYLERPGRVIEVEEDITKITLQRHTACAECGGCAAGRGDKKMIIEAVNKIDAKVGDLVMVELSDENFLFAAFLAYAVPVICLFLGYFLGVKISIFWGRTTQEQAFGIIGAFIFLGLSFLGLKFLNPKFTLSNRFVPTVSKIIERFEQQ